MQDEVRLLFDIGNTRIKFAVGVGVVVGAVHGCLHSQIADLHCEIARLLESTPIRRAALATVHPELGARLTRQLECMGIEVAVFASDGRLFDSGLSFSDLTTPETTGIDRLLSAVGALAKAPDCDVIVIDCGSAATVNLTTADRTFRGGAILPGFQLMAAALHHRTAALPQASADAPPPLPAKNTYDAISAGIFAAVTGGIEKAVAFMLKSIRDQEESKIFLTGGDSLRIQSHLRLTTDLQPHLVLEGLAICSM